MMTKEDLKDLIPHGMFKEIAVRAGVSTGAVTKYFNNKIKSSFKIQKAAMEVALECKATLENLELKLKN